jgi:DNA repair protein SbcC/Rad50
VLLTRLYLRNFRVYEDELDLPLPPGLVGIYGPNGAGKSALLEAILFTLWGKSRTNKDQVRSSGVGGECVTEVEFEHEGHLYLVRRSLRGLNSNVSVEVHCDGTIMSTGTRDAERYVESVLGMDDGAFRASVFTEQKQLAAFSDQSPAERRKLVLHLLGITPLDAARDAARKEARQVTADHDRLRGMLADVEALRVEAEDAAATADAADVRAEVERTAAGAAEAVLATASARRESLDQTRQEYDALVVEGKAARHDLDAVVRRLGEQRSELAELDRLGAALTDLETRAGDLGAATEELELLGMASGAARAVAGITVPPEPEAPDEDSLESAASLASTARERLAAVEALAQASAAELERARQLAERSATLSGEEDCPVCGQALGEAFEAVQAHRAEEVAAAVRRTEELGGERGRARKASRDADAGWARIRESAEEGRRRRREWEQAAGRYQEAVGRLEEAWMAVVAVAPGRAAGGRPGGRPDRPGDGGGGAPRGPSGHAGSQRLRDEWPAGIPQPDDLAEAVGELRRRVDDQRRARSEIDRIRGRLERRPALEAALARDEEAMDAATDRVQNLRDKVKALGFDPLALQGAVQAYDEAAAAHRRCADAATEAALQAARQRERAAAAAKRLSDAEQQHLQLADLESRARHTSRVGDLLSEFRNTVVASVGPRLAVQAAELFGELTDNEYDQLQVDPETFQLQISDGGRVYGLDRFSGSEIDLANLALRVAISEHIHFQSGGSIGLLVLDEVFGPLDEDRKARMLLALERLRGRFRQVLVVTHDSTIKDQLPNAIEVVKLPGRRATARVVAG